MDTYLFEIDTWWYLILNTIQKDHLISGRVRGIDMAKMNHKVWPVWDDPIFGKKHGSVCNPFHICHISAAWYLSHGRFIGSDGLEPTSKLRFACGSWTKDPGAAELFVGWTFINKAQQYDCCYYYHNLRGYLELGLQRESSSLWFGGFILSNTQFGW